MASSSSPRLTSAIVVALGAIFAAPLGYVIVQNVRLGADLGEILGSSNTWSPLANSVLLATSVAASAGVVGTALAWLIIRTDLPGRRVFVVLAPLPLVFPSFVGATAMIAAFARGGLLDEWFGLDNLPELAGFRAAWFVLTLFTYPYVYLPVAARLRQLPPSVEESARLLGRTPARVFISVVLPQIRTAVSAGMLLVFLYAVSDFGAVQLLRYDTLTRVIFQNGLADRGTSMVLSLVLGLMALAVVASERWLMRRDLPLGGRTNRPASQYPLGPLRWPGWLAVTGFFLGALAGPTITLAHWAARGWQSERTRGAFALDADGLTTAVFNTVVVSIIAAVVTVIVVLPISYLSVRHRSRLGDVVNSVVVGGFALPGLVVALSFVYWTANSDILRPLYQTLPLLVLAYVIHFGAQASGASQVALAAVSTQMDDAARMLGAGRVRRFRSVELPLMLPGLLAAGGLVLLSAMKELPTTLFLRPTGFDTLATEIWSEMQTLSYAQAGLDSLILLAVSAILTWALVIRNAPHL